MQLSDVVITHKLQTRTSRAPDLTSENQALHDLARSLGGGTKGALEQLLNISLNLCEAGTVGISILEKGNGGELFFRWIAVAGKLSSSVGGCSPRDNSPCGYTFDRNAPQLFSWPGRYFTCVAEARPPIAEGLVVPFYDADIPWGTIWIATHKEKEEFDMEDVRVMESVSGFTSAILRLAGYSPPVKTAGYFTPPVSGEATTRA